MWKRSYIPSVLPKGAIVLVVIALACGDGTDPFPSPVGQYYLTQVNDPNTAQAADSISPYCGSGSALLLVEGAERVFHYTLGFLWGPSPLNPGGEVHCVPAISVGGRWEWDNSKRITLRPDLGLERPEIINATYDGVAVEFTLGSEELTFTRSTQ